MKRGRPEQETIVSPTKYSIEYIENNSSGDIIHRWDYNLNKYNRGPVNTEVIYPKNYDFGKPKKLDNSRYINEPIVMVYKTSERSNARYKLKVWMNKNIDQILRGKGIGVNEDMIVIELGIGNQLIEEYKQKYKDNLKN